MRCGLLCGWIVLALALCSCGRGGQIVIGSKNFIEQLLLGEMAAQQLERKLHEPVGRKLNLGGTLLAHEAILHDDIDIYPEYTGTASSVVLKLHVSTDPNRAYEQVRDAYLKQFSLRWLPPLGFNDTFAMVVRSDDARALAQPTLSASVSRKWRLGVGYEFLTREDGLRKLDETYRIPWSGTPRNMDLGLLYQALEQRNIDMGAASSTDAQLTDGRFQMLRDDKETFPPYNACFVVREELLQRRPEVAAALNLLRNRIDEKKMRDLNRQVVFDHQPITKVVKDFLDGLENSK